MRIRLLRVPNLRNHFFVAVQGYSHTLNSWILYKSIRGKSVLNERYKAQPTTWCNVTWFVHITHMEFAHYVKSTWCNVRRFFIFLDTICATFINFYAHMVPTFYIIRKFWLICFSKPLSTYLNDYGILQEIIWIKNFFSSSEGTLCA